MSKIILKPIEQGEYEVNPLTMAVIAKQNTSGKNLAHVLEANAEYVISQAPTNIIDISCSFFGSSLRGRQEGTRNICGITHKAPISIDPSSGMYFFPTASPANSLCSWISHSHIKEINPTKHQCTEVVFKNDQRIILDVSIGSMMNQVQRTAQFRYILDERLKR